MGWWGGGVVGWFVGWWWGIWGGPMQSKGCFGRLGIKETSAGSCQRDVLLGGTRVVAPQCLQSPTRVLPQLRSQLDVGRGAKNQILADKWGLPTKPQ